MNFEHGLLAKIIFEGELEPAITAGITVDDFEDLNYREVYQYLIEHYAKHGEVATEEFIEDLYPDFDMKAPPIDGVAALSERVREKRVYNEIAHALEKVADAAEASPFEAVEQAHRLFASITTLVRREDDTDITKQSEQIWSEYQRVKHRKGLLGLPYPWPVMNEATLGMRPENLIFIYGRPESMKTWTMMAMADHIHRTLGKNVVFVSQEMGTEELRERAVSLFCGIDYLEYTHGKLPTRQEREFKDNLEAWSESPPYIVTGLYTTGSAAVAEFEAKVAEYRAPVAFFDGVYLAGNEREEVVAVTQGLKRVARKLKIPIVGTCQENRMGQVAHSDSFLQDADVLLKIKRGPEERKNSEVVIHSDKFRRGFLSGFAIHARPGANMSEKHTLREDEEESQFEE